MQDSGIPLKRSQRQVYNPKPKQGPPSFDLPLKLTKMLQHTIAREMDYPSRPEMLDCLDEAAPAARLLICKLSDPRMAALLYGDEMLSEIIDGLEIVVTRAEAARKQTKQKIYPQEADGPSARELCVLIVGLVCEQRSGDWPKQDNREAWKVCEEFWQSAGGKHRRSKGWGNNANSGWRDYLKAARKYVKADTPVVQYLRQIINPVLQTAPTTKSREPGDRGWYNTLDGVKAAS